MKSHITSREILMIARSVAIAGVFVLVLAVINPWLIPTYLMGAALLGYHWKHSDKYRPYRFASKRAQRIYEAKHFALALLVIPVAPIGFVVSRLAKLTLKTGAVK